MSTLMRPIPLTLLPMHETTWDTLGDLTDAYKLPDYEQFMFGPGRWTPLYVDAESICGVLWTNDLDGCGVIRLGAPGFDPVAYTAVALRLRTLLSEGVSATDAFNFVCDAHSVRETRVGELEALISAIVETYGDQ